MAKTKVGDRVLQGTDGYYGYAECIEYFSKRNITVRFDNTGEVRYGVCSSQFRNGEVKDLSVSFIPNSDSVIGSRYLQGKDGCYGYAECIAYRGSVDIDIRFDNTGLVREGVHLEEFKRGEVKDYLAPTVYGVGVVGKKYINEDEEFAYMLWSGMLNRVTTSENSDKACRFSHYIDVTCSDDFLYFCKFRDWLFSLDNYNDAYTAWKMYGWIFQLDKDILYPGRRVYSSDACILVPLYVNSSIVSRYEKRDYPTGVYVQTNKSGVRISISRAAIDLKSYRKCFGFVKYNCDTENRDYWREVALKYYTHYDIEYRDEELAAIGAAWLEYKRVKEQYVRDVAELYRNYPTEDESCVYHMIDERCYNALMNWTIDITD